MQKAYQVVPSICHTVYLHFSVYDLNRFVQEEALTNDLEKGMLHKPCIFDGFLFKCYGLKQPDFKKHSFRANKQPVNS